ncbi:hypothetical protein BG011_002581 [Mortierella polycephala]|uniref:Uncharacterized protein n=1 Tax=Mortierella polycephala TaxID=41804 RepID=A0A9P6Q5Q8_9FUNG|nr:hypothetical protein BG011_002581 [Mortierella polycephala]
MNDTVYTKSGSDEGSAKDTREHEADQSEASAVSRLDLTAELTFAQERLAVIEKEDRTGADGEKVALEEFTKSTQALIESRSLLNEKQAQLDALDESDTTRSSVQSELDQLTEDAKHKEHQWSATKEVYHREFGPITEDSSSSVTQVKAKAEHDIKALQEQIANLQKQLNAVSIKRKQMVADAEEQQKRLDEQDTIDNEQDDD